MMERLMSDRFEPAKKWRKLTKAEASLVARLWQGKDTLLVVHSVAELLARNMGDGYCLRLSRPDQINVERQGYEASAFVGDAVDYDQVMVQAVLVIGLDFYPLELEIFRQDGKYLNTPLEELDFHLVRED